MRLFVDRIEGEYAVCQNENEEKIELLLSALPDNVKEGSVLTSDENGNFVSDFDEEEKRRRLLFEMQNSIFDE